MEGILGLGVIVLVVPIGWWAISIYRWRRDIRARLVALRAEYPVALITSAQVAAVTHRALKRIMKAQDSGVVAPRTGPYYSVVVVAGSLLLIGGASPLRTVAIFRSDEVRDGRVGKTQWMSASYTTLFLGVRAGGTTFELPIRVNGPKETSMFPATEERAVARWAQLESALRARS